jgi:hypothetical protein
MESNSTEVKQIASELLAGMLSNPHVYTSVSDEGMEGQREQMLVMLALEMAQESIEKAEKSE